MRPKAYEGKENYIFVSYSHKDTEQAFQVMQTLQEEGYRIWYDDGIVPGSEWPENIAQHLNGAAMVMALITPNSMESHNCRREINFALAKMKPFLSVVLEPTEMSLGMEMQLSAQHNILRYNYEKWEDFIQKILSCPDIEPCKITDQAEYTENLKPEDTSADSEDDTTAVQSEDPVPGKTKVKKQKEKKKKEKKNGKKLPIKKLLVIAAAVAALAIATVFIIPKTTTIELSWGETISKSNNYVFLYHETLTQKDLEAIAGIKDLTSLKIEGCDLSGCDFSHLTFASPALTELKIIGSSGVNDFSFLNGLVLNTLVLDGCTAFDDLSIVDLSQMMNLDISGTAVSDLSCLQDTQIRSLAFDQTAVTDLSVLATMDKLTTVSGNDCAITSIDALTGLENLTDISFNGCPIGAMTGTFQSLRLDTVCLANCGMTDLGAFRDVTQLNVLDMRGNADLTDMTWMDAQNYETLTELYLGGTGLTQESVAFITDCPYLECLDLNGIPMTDLAVCGSLTGLKTLYAAGCGLTDISALSACENLNHAILSFNQIENADPLIGMLQTDYPIIDLSYNSISDLSSWDSGEIDVLFLHGNAVDLALTIPADLSAFYLSMDWCEGLGESDLTAFGRGIGLYLLGCPNNHKLQIEEQFGSGYVQFVTEPELYEIIQNSDMLSADGIDYTYPAQLYQMQ